MFFVQFFLLNNEKDLQDWHHANRHNISDQHHHQEHHAEHYDLARGKGLEIKRTLKTFLNKMNHL